jgi:hypothetical protein
MEDNFAELIRSLTSEQIMAKLPDQARKFFTEHPPLFKAWCTKFENPALARQMEAEYFGKFSPDLQYALVYDISELHRSVGSLQAALSVVKQHKGTSRLDEAERFQRYGLNVHITAEQFGLIVRALTDQTTLARMAMQSTTDRVLIAASVKESELNKQVFNSLNEQLAKFYPNLLTKG